MTSRLCVVHCLPSAIRLAEYIVLDVFWGCAERPCNEVPRDPNAVLSAIDTRQIRNRPGLVLDASHERPFTRCRAILPAISRLTPPVWLTAARRIPDAVSVLEVQADIPDVPPYALEDAEFALPTRDRADHAFSQQFHDISRRQR